MAIKKIKITNFKSFQESEITLSKLNVLIGANASGKSNFIQIFKFLRDVANYGLDNAISLQGGVEYLRNISIGSSSNFSLEVVLDQKQVHLPFLSRLTRTLIGIQPYEAIYNLALNFKKKGRGFRIVDDKLTLKGEFVKFGPPKHRMDEIEKLGQGEIIFSKINGEIKTSSSNLPEDITIGEYGILPPFLAEKLQPRTLLLEIPFFLMPRTENIFYNLGIYDFDPKLPKQAVPITGKAELEDDGKNLAIVIKNIIEDKDKERKFSNLVKDLLPFIRKVNIEKFADKSLLFKLQENYFKNQYIPASLISDGTINISALIIALYFDKKLLTIIEEPERNIHPYLISKVIDMMKDASQKKQIIVTTHNPEVIKWAGLENILFVSRDKEGFSTISKLYEKESVKTFLKNEIGIEELYVQNLLAV
jgi:predicted ATPase